MLNFLKISSFQYGFSLVGGHLDKFIISKYFGLEALGIYSFVVNYFVYLHGLLINIFKIILPKISKLHGDNDIYNLNNILKKSLKYSLYLSIFLSVFSLLIWESFISFYIDNKFAINSYVYIQLFMILLIVRSFDPVFFYYFNAIAKPFFLLLGVIIVSSITVIGYLIFVRIFEIYGLIISQILAALTVNIYFFYLTSKKENYYEK
jgi:O-antigen/teichoic acid export membrane protein